MHQEKLYFLLVRDFWFWKICIGCARVQGRYDVVCPMKSAWDLHQAIPHSKLEVTYVLTYRAVM